jgi:tryptophan-rich sensory protein
MITIQMDKTTSLKHGVVLSICIVIMFHWCCFVHLYCDHVSLVLFCPSVLRSCFSIVDMITIQMYKNNTSETWSQYRWTKHQ